MRYVAVAVSFLAGTAAMMAATTQERLNDAAGLFSEIMSTPDKGIPQDLLAKAECVVIVPGMKKAAFVVGGEYGRGFAECRNPKGTGWGAPAAVRMEGGSVGFQIGGSSTDLVLLVMSRRGMDKLVQDKFTLGADASVAAGPVGRTANAGTDVKMTAEILAWSRAKGLFAGISLNGATLRSDDDRNQDLYGRKITNKEVLESGMKPPESARALNEALDKYSMRREGPDAERSVRDH
ncbi:MAG: lipid-binding SYLF domain-containing protein [Acidobacteriia bacterium]|nr:lipid-binding SYLF domain-containing protein [Terriglobia bacterium]